MLYCTSSGDPLMRLAVRCDLDASERTSGEERQMTDVTELVHAQGQMSNRGGKIIGGGPDEFH